MDTTDKHLDGTAIAKAMEGKQVASTTYFPMQAQMYIRFTDGTAVVIFCEENGLFVYNSQSLYVRR